MKMLLFALILNILFVSKVCTVGYMLTRQLREQFCVDNTSLAVDDYVEKYNRRFRIYFNDSQGVEYEGTAVWNRSDHFPIFEAAKKSEFSLRKMTIFFKNDEMRELIFDPNYGAFTGISKIGSVWRLIGFNQIWLGCPQPMCLHSHIDDASSDHIPGHTFIYRGDHYWRPGNDSKTPLSMNAVLMNEVRFPDCGFKRGDYLYLFKDDCYYTMTLNGTWVSRCVPLTQYGHRGPVPEHSDAAVAPYAYDIFFKGDTVWWGNLHNKFTFETKKAPEELRNLDAAVELRGGNSIIVFKGQRYTTVEMNQSTLSFGKIDDWKSTALEFLGCDFKNTVFRDHKTFEEKIGMYFDGKPWPMATMQTPTTSMNTTLTSIVLDTVWTMTVITVALLGLCCVFSYFIFFEFKKRSKGNKQRK